MTTIPSESQMWLMSHLALFLSWKNILILLVSVGLLVLVALVFKCPFGYEDEEGFHESQPKAVDPSSQKGKNQSRYPFSRASTSISRP